MVMHKLTLRQIQVLDLIRECLDSTGMPPTRAEIARQLGFRSPNAADDHLRALARKGVITLIPGASRGIRLADRHGHTRGLPVVGRVAAGSPILSEQHIEDHLDIRGDVFRPRADYLLRVFGMSMREAGIIDGDLLAVHRTQDVTSGQIVVARVNEEVTVKRYRHRGHQVYLLPENPEFATILVDLRHHVLEIEGLGVGVVRKGKAL
jgi:repressor LexA